MQAHPIELLNLKTQKRNQFLAKGLETIEDIAFFFPRKYIDFREITSVKKVKTGGYYALQGMVVDVYYQKNRSIVIAEEQSVINGWNLPKFSVVWFNSDFYAKRLTIGDSYIFCGQVSEYKGRSQIVSPILIGKSKKEVCKILPIYSKIKGMSENYLLQKIQESIIFLKAVEKAGEKEAFANQLGLMDKFLAIKELHQPTSGKAYKEARKRIDFEKIYDFYEALAERQIHQSNHFKPLKNTAVVTNLVEKLPFALTDDQEKAIQRIIQKAQAGQRIYSLISGDVGCGKTMIAILAAIFMWENGYQTILMAPTQVLAAQHYNEFLAYGADKGVKIGLLTTSTEKQERKNLMEGLKDGSLDILIGTHSVLNAKIEPAKLGMTIIDEEHKFGVQQKEKLEKFDRAGIHHLSMTATPIPRSIAMTVYGTDLDVIPIQTMPKGRKAIITKQYYRYQDALEKMYEEIMAGKQGYIVCPFIDDSENPQFKDVISVASAKAAAEKFFANKPQAVRVGSINGDMKQKDILENIEKFAAKKFDVLVSTTIVEVGVNIPNASVILRILPLPCEVK